jgi:prepilin-type N-terminal cleavage/methylation domain-containing protein
VKKRERGYTLVELLVTLAISGIIFTAVGSAIYQLSTVSGYGNDRLTANHELQNSAIWFSRDTQSAWQVSAGKNLKLSLPEDRSVTYSLEGKDLVRREKDSSLVLARNISAVGFAVNGGLVSMNIESSPAGRAEVIEKRVYQVCFRSFEP